MTQHDAWKTTNRAQEQAEMGHEAFQRSQEYMDAYVNYCDVFDTSDAYDAAFENWMVGEDEVEAFVDEAEYYDDSDWRDYTESVGYDPFGDL